MARTINKLTARAVAALKEPGRHSDGGGLYLRITSAGAKSWVFMTAKDGCRSEIGLGSSNSVSLAAVRTLAARMREAVELGKDPRSVIELEAEVVTTPTFGAFADEYISSIESGWRNAVHRQQWRNSLRDHASVLRDVPVDEVDTDKVMHVLEPIWLTKTETAKRLRGRIERILDAAKVKKLRGKDSTNPAMYRGHLALLLPDAPKLARGHHPALRWEDAPSFYRELATRPAIAARCLEFTILTAARSGEALGATWGEIDFDRALWTVPRARMKASVQHVVPLSNAALSLLLRLKPEEVGPEAAIFAVRGAKRSNMAMSMLLRRMGYHSITVHGFRSTFRDWAGDATEFPREIVEQALAHTISSKTERSYRRGNALERRRGVMQAWADYLGGSSSDGETGGEG